MLGEEVRLIDVPADAGNGLGIYERLPDNISPAQYADNLELSCKNYYGTPQQAFLKKFIHQIAEDIDLVKNQIECSIKEFMDEHNVDGSKGYEARMAKRFALAYARRLSENKTLKRVAPNCVLRNLKISEAKFKIDQNMHRFDVSTGSYWTYPVYFYLYCRVCGEISKLWTD